ncbi:MAG: hypothetical protein M3131_02230, partial [Actinomycetota bacterium]|nr:hypothetical protein [Actinomycetota bacterium]
MEVPLHMQASCIGIALGVTLALGGASAAEAAELVAAAGEQNRLVATQGEVTAFVVKLHAEGKISCGAHERHAALASIETSYSIVDGTVREGGRPSGPQRFFRAHTAQPPPKGGCPVSWTTSPDPYRIEASVAVSPDTPPGDYAAVLRATSIGGFGGLLDEKPTTITVRVLRREHPAGPPPPPPPPAASTIVPPPPSPVLDLPPPRENLSVNVLPVRGRVLVRYPGAQKPVLLEEPLQVPVRSTLDTTAGRVELVSDKDGRGGLQSASFWNGRFAVGYTRAVVASARSRERRARRRASRPIT